jgi:hypothetical protein
MPSFPPNFRRALACQISTARGLARGLRDTSSFRTLVFTAVLACLAASASSLALARGHHHHRGQAACAGFHRARAAFASASRHRLRFTDVRNSFGADMFGIAAGGSIQVEPPSKLASELSADHLARARWLRIDINWAAIQNGGPNSYSWGATDRVVRRAAACGMHVLGGIVYTPRWDRPSGASANYGPNPAAYARFAATAVRHYSRLGVSAYEIWNEPNSPTFWQPKPNPTWYTAVLKAAYRAIKSVDPWTVVLTGGTAPAPTRGESYSPVDFLKDIYADGGRGYFDAVGHHPYCWPAFPGAPHRWSAWYEMYGTQPSLRSVMIANGDGAKKIWATEFGAPTDGPRGTYVSKAQQARMVIRAYRLFSHYSWAGPLFFFQGRDQGTNRGSDENFFGFLSHSFRPKPSYAAYLSAATALGRS